MKKSLLLAIALTLSGTVFATDVDDFVKNINIEGIADNGGLCNAIKTYYPVKQVICYQTDRPLYMVKDKITAVFAINNILHPVTSIITAYNFGNPAFKEKYDGFFELNAHTDLTKSEGKNIGISLGYVSKYLTAIVVYSY
ncbi:hypothetical protein [Deinococcus sp. UYEF24]